MSFVKDYPSCRRSRISVFAGKARQKGAVMIVALMLLLVMTILAVSGIGSSVLEQRMSGNYYRSATAFEAAEFGLRVAEQWMNAQVVLNPTALDWFTTETTMTGLYTTQVLATPNVVEVCGGNLNCAFDPRNESSWCMGGAGCDLPKGFVTLGDTLKGVNLATFSMPVSRQPQFIIEHIGVVGEPGIQMGVDDLDESQTGFRITVIGWGQEGVSHHILQTHVLLTL